MNWNEIKWIAIGAVVLAALSYGLGRYTGQTPVTQTTTKVDQVDQTNTHQQETITETKKPDGTDTTVTVINTVKNETEKTDTQTQVKPNPRLNLSVLAAVSIHDPLVPAYGLSVNKEYELPIVGPATVGAFGLTNGMIGISIGKNF